MCVCARALVCVEACLIPVLRPARPASLAVPSSDQAGEEHLLVFGASVPNGADRFSRWSVFCTRAAGPEGEVY